LSDIYGNSYHLYDLLDQGKMVVIEFSATWCGPCWNYMMTGALENFWNDYGPNGSNQAQVFFIESDQNTGMADLLGQTSSSQGNWVAEIPFPIIDLQWGQHTDDDYEVNYYPTLYAVCSDHKCYELGQVGESEWAEFITSCSLSADLVNVQQAVCYGTGSATITSSGGVPPIHYNWSNGDHDPVMQNVGAGVYGVTVSEGNGREVSIDNIVITGAEYPITLFDSEVESALCNGASTGSISIELQDGTPPFTYDWSNGAHAQNLVNIPADVYTVNATDAHGCPYEGTFTVTEPDPIEVQSTITPDYCDQINGSVTLDIQGGVGTYAIDASQGIVSGHVVHDLPPGFVNVTVEDGNGCLWTTNYEIEEEPAPSLYFTPDPFISCTQLTTTVTGYVNQGSGDFAYFWTTSNGHIVGPNDQASIVVDQPGDYNLNLMDLFSGCEAENAVAVMSLVDPPVTSAGDDAPINCENLAVTLNGSGDANYTVNWTTQNGHIVSGGNSYQPVVDAPGDYTITVINPQNSCSNSDTVTILNDYHPAAAAYNFQTSTLTMIGTDQSTGSNLTGWSWDFGDGNTSTDPSVVHTFAVAGTYQVCHGVQNGCGPSQICQMVEVTYVGSVISVDTAIGHVLCYGDSTGYIT
ncbi:MAG TPA: PKD domain-containing protein, partial [Saprospiraceae bacterium]|nr:PKD domain-containing protein [Saprospiraceae bacterium]